MLERLAFPVLAVALVALLPGVHWCSPATVPTARRSTETPRPALPLRHPFHMRWSIVTADTVGFLSEPNIVSFKGMFPDKRPKPVHVIGVGDVLNVSIFEAAPGGLFTPGTSAGARPGNFVDLPPQAVDQKGAIYIPYAGEIPAAGRTIPDISQAIIARLRNRAIEPQVVVSLNQQHSSIVSVLGAVNAPGVLALNSVGERNAQSDRARRRLEVRGH